MANLYCRASELDSILKTWNIDFRPPNLAAMRPLFPLITDQQALRSVINELQKLKKITKANVLHILKDQINHGPIVVSKQESGGEEKFRKKLQKMTRAEIIELFMEYKFKKKKI